MTPEPMKIDNCASEKSISIFYDSISQEELSDFVQKIQQYLSGEFNGPFKLTDSRISETEYSRRVFLLFDENKDQFDFSQNDVVITSNQVEPGMCLALRICAKCAVLRCFCAFCAKQNSAEPFEIAQKPRKTSKFYILRAKQRKIFARFLLDTKGWCILV